MELMAVIIGLEAIKTKDKKVIIYSDSKYVIDSFDKGWIYNWEREGFYKRTNADLFIRLLNLYRSFPNIEFSWVKGHNGHEENEKCDVLAVAMSSRNPQTEDTGYLEQLKNNKDMSDIFKREVADMYLLSLGLIKLEKVDDDIIRASADYYLKKTKGDLSKLK